MDLLTLLDEVKKLAGHGYVRWSTGENGEIILHTGLTARDETGKVDPDLFDNLRKTETAVNYMTMGD